MLLRGKLTARLQSKGFSIIQFRFLIPFFHTPFQCNPPGIKDGDYNKKFGEKSSEMQEMVDSEREEMMD